MANNTTQDPRSRMGGVGTTSPQRCYAMVVATQPDRLTHTLTTMSAGGGSAPLYGVPRIRSSPQEIVCLPIGTTVVVSFDLGMPVIDGVLEIPSAAATTPGIPTTGVAGSGLDGTTNRGVGSYRGPAEPSDLLPGDHVFANKSGARVGVLEGGLALLAGSPLAQVRAHGLGDLVEILSRNFRHVTDMGISEIKNADGRVNWSFRGGSDQTNETGADEENWTIRMDLGSEGDLFNFELTTPQGQTLFKLHVDANGRCELFGRDGVIIQSGAASGEPHVSEHGGDSQDIVRGDREVLTVGDVAATTQGNRAETVDGDATLACGNDLSQQAVRDYGLAVGRNAHYTFAGDGQDHDALAMDVRTGHAKIAMGAPTFPTAKFAVTTLAGDMTFESSSGGNFKVTSLLGEASIEARTIKLKTLAPDSVILGGDTLASHITKFEELKATVNMLMSLLDNHSHPYFNLPPNMPMKPWVMGMLDAAQSLRAGVGG